MSRAKAVAACVLLVLITGSWVICMVVQTVPRAMAQGGDKPEAAKKEKVESVRAEAVRTSPVMRAAIPVPVREAPVGQADIAAPTDEEYTKVEIRGTLIARDAPGGPRSYQVRSQEHHWRLDVGRDRVLRFLGDRLDGQVVVVTGFLRIEARLETIVVTRIEPVAVQGER